MSDIIERNTDLASIQHNAFIFKTAISGTVNSDRNNDGKISRGEPAIANAKVQLINTDDGSVVATETTNRHGQYSFDVADGLRTGVYQVQVTKTDGSVVVSSKDTAITGGDDFERVNLAVPTPAPPKPTPPKPAPPKTTPPKSGGSGHQMTQSVAAASQRTPKPASHPQVAPANASNIGSNVSRSPNSAARPAITGSTSGKNSQQSLTTSSNVQSNSVASLSQLHTLIDTMFASLPHGML